MTMTRPAGERRPAAKLDPDARGGLRLTLAVVAGLLLAIPFALLLLLVVDHWGPLQRLDLRLDTHLNAFAFQHAGYVSLLQGISLVGSPASFEVLAAVGAVILLVRRQPRLAAWLAVTVFGGGLLSTVVKSAVGRKRPLLPHPVAHAASASFPSGHALGSVVGVGALLLVGHGSHLNADSSAPVYTHAKAIRERGLFDEVRTAFWKEEPSLSRALDGCDSNDVTVVPVFMSAGYFTNEVIPREMGLSGRVTCLRGRRVRYTDPVGSHPALAKAIVQRALEAGATPDQALAVLGHGTERNRQSQANIYQQTENVRALGGFFEVVTLFMDQAPGMDEVFALTTAPEVVVVPVFIADGWHAGQTIPDELGGLASAGRRLRYAAAVGTHPGVADVILELVRDAAAW